MSTIALPCSAAAQRTIKNTASATVASLGRVESVSSLNVRQRTNGGNVYMDGKVTTVHNGPYQLQSQLSRAHPDAVYGWTPDGTYVQLSTTAWVTVAAGAGGKNRINSVDYYLVWAKKSSKRPQDAVSIPVAYRVIPR